MLGLIAEKIGMTQLYGKDGAFVPVTVVRLLPHTVVGIKTKEKHGYNSVQMGYGEQKENRLNKPQREHLKKLGLKPCVLLKEFRTDKSTAFKIGQVVSAKCLNIGDQIDVQGTSKGRGFQGVMKRYHFAGGMDSHGCSVSHRAPGSIGQRAYAGRVFPGKKMPGHMGDATVTLKNLQIVGVESEQNLILIKGAVPGGKRARLFIYPHASDFESRVLSSAGQALDAVVS